MDIFCIRGGTPLHGRIALHGAKNAALPLLAATLATGARCELLDCPDISDVTAACAILRHLGCAVEQHGGIVAVDAGSACRSDIPAELMRKMRAAVLFLGPLLARFGTTAGKWCMGITVTRPDGERLSYSEALNRTALVWFYGAGLGLPLVELVCSYLSYRRYTRGEELAWESGSIERFDERGTGKMALLCAASWAVCGTLTVAMALAAMLPPNRGDLTVAEFAENVNFYRGYFDCGERWSLDENGEWAENQYENVVYFGGGDGPAPFTYTVEDGTLRAVHWAYTETAETIYGTGDENARVAYLALAAAQKGTSLFNIRSVIAQIDADRWEGDADYSAVWKNVEMRYDAQIEGEYYYSEGFFLSVQDGQPITVTLTFDARLAE